MGTKKTFGVFAALSLVYLGLTFGIPVDSASLNKYQLSNAEIQLLRLSLALPIIAIWMVAFYGYDKLRKYASLVKDSPESEGWLYIVKGLLVLALWLPVNSIINNVTTHIYTSNRDLTEEMVILNNYLNLLIILGSFMLLYKGANRLVKSIGKPLPDTLKSTGMALLVVESAVFAYLTLTSSTRSIPLDETTPAAYYLPDWLLLLTIVIPYIIVFYLGLRVVQDIYAYRSNVKGALYQKALKFLAQGIGLVVLSLMAIRYLTSLTTLFSDATLKLILLIVYLLLLLIAAGYILIALGSKRLQKLEEV